MGSLGLKALQYESFEAKGYIEYMIITHRPLSRCFLMVFYFRIL